MKIQSSVQRSVVSYLIQLHFHSKMPTAPPKYIRSLLPTSDAIWEIILDRFDLTGGDREYAVLRTFLNRRFRGVKVHISKPNQHSDLIGISGSQEKFEHRNTSTRFDVLGIFRWRTPRNQGFRYITNQTVKVTESAEK